MIPKKDKKKQKATFKQQAAKGDTRTLTFKSESLLLTDFVGMMQIAHRTADEYVDMCLASQKPIQLFAMEKHTSKLVTVVEKIKSVGRICVKEINLREDTEGKPILIAIITDLENQMPMISHTQP